jgi:septal ring factor EnvC (AmiA/AmiB activator)
VPRLSVLRMGYLMSLVGKDQENITEAIKEMAENVENIKNQEKEITDLLSELDEEKDKIQYLQSKLNQKYDIIEDMECNLDRAEEKFKYVEKQETRDNNQSMVGQISENIKMEKKISVQSKVITESKEKLKEQTEY